MESNLPVATSTPSVVADVLRAYDAGKAQFTMASGAIKNTKIQTLIQGYFGPQLALSKAARPIYDAAKKRISFQGTVSFSVPGTTYRLDYETQVVFAVKPDGDANNPESWILLLSLSINLAVWRLTSFFPGLAGTTLESLALANGPAGIRLASEAFSDRFAVPPLSVPMGASFFGATVFANSFPGLKSFLPSAEPLSFQGAVEFRERGGVHLELTVTQPIPSPVSNYRVQFQVGLVANIPAKQIGEESVAPGAPALSTVRLALLLPLPGGREAWIEGFYHPEVASLSLQLRSNDKEALSLADLAGYLPADISRTLAASFPTDQLKKVLDSTRIFQLRLASIGFDLGKLDVNSLAASLDIVPEAAGFGKLSLDLLIGKLVLEKINLAASVRYPFAAHRSTNVVLSAHMGLFGIPMLARANTSGDLSLSLQDGAKLAIAPVFAQFTGLPANAIPDLKFTSLGLSVNLATYALELGASVEPWDLAWGEQILRFENASANFKLNPKSSSESEPDSPRYAGAIAGGVSALGAKAEFNLSVNENWAIDFALKELMLGKVIQDVTGADTIPFLSKAKLEKLAVRATPAKGAVRFEAELTDIRFPADNPVLEIHQAVVTFNQVSKGNWSLFLKFTVSATLEKAVRIDRATFQFEYDRIQKKWTIDSKVAAKLFDHTIQLDVSYSGSPASELLTFTYAADLNLLQLGSIGVACKSFALKLERTARGTDCYASADGRVVLDQVFDFAGKLSIFSAGPKKGIALDIEKGADFEATLARIGTLAAGIKGSFEQLGLSHDTKGWAIAAKGRLAVTGLPEYAYRTGIVPREGVNVTLAANSAGASIGVEGAIVDIKEFRIPDLVIDRTPVSLNKYGAASIAVKKLKVVLGKELLLTATLSVGLPERLNEMFDLKDGKPALNIFKVRPHTVDTTFGFGIKNGKPAIYFELESLPFLPNLVEREGTKWKIDLGECGKLLADTPVFSFNGTGFEFKGGVSGLRSLKIPLTPLKTFLVKVKADKLAEVLPAKPLPMPDIRLLNNEGNFNATELVRILNTILPVSDRIRDELTKLSAYGSRLPQRFKQYLNFEMIDAIQWKISIAGSASIDIDIAIDDVNKPRDQRRPLQLVFPVMVGPMPALQGVRLYGFSLGALLGGTLFSLRLDCDFDQFDLASLALAMAIDPNAPLPIARNFHRSVVIDRLWMPIIYYTGVPVPIPLFYDRLALEYRGIEGIEVEAHVGFPEPDLNPMAYLSLLLNFIDFIRKPEARINPNLIPEKAGLRFFMSRWFIRLPGYLGGHLIGNDKDRFVNENLVQRVAQVLNGIKHVSMDDILLIMQEYKLTTGKESVAFGPVWLTADWAISRTLTEAGTLVPIPADHLARLGEVDTEFNNKGLKILLHGQCTVAQLTGLKVTFNVAAGSAQGFASSLVIKGDIGVLSYESFGSISIAEKGQPPVLIKLENELKLGFLSIMGGKFAAAFSKEAVVVRGEFHLFPQTAPFNIRSDGVIQGSVTSTGLAVKGGVVSTLGSLPFAGVTVDVSNQRVLFSGTFLGTKLDLVATATRTEAKLFGQVTVGGVVELTSTISIGASPLHATATLTGRLGDLSLEIKGALPNPKSSISVKLLGVELVSGDASVTGDSFAISGGINVFPPGAPLAFRINASGQLNSFGLAVGGSSHTGINVGPLGEIKLNSAANLRPSGLSIESSVEVTVAGVRTHAGGRSGIERFRNAVCFCGHYHVNIIFPVNLYIAIGPHILEVTLHRPHGWPGASLELNAPETTGGSLVPRLESPNEPPAHVLGILEIVQALERSGVRQSTPGEGEEVNTDAWTLAQAYGLSYADSPLDGKPLAESTRTRRQISIVQSHRHDDFIIRFKQRGRIDGLEMSEVFGLMFESEWEGGVMCRVRLVPLDADRKPFADISIDPSVLTGW
jgi:hypothetical protein